MRGYTMVANGSIYVRNMYPKEWSEFKETGHLPELDLQASPPPDFVTPPHKGIYNESDKWCEEFASCWKPISDDQEDLFRCPPLSLTPVISPIGNATLGYYLPFRVLPDHEFQPVIS